MAPPGSSVQRMLLLGPCINMLWTLENLGDLRSISSVQAMLLLGSWINVLWTLDPCWRGSGREREGARGRE